MMMDNKKQRRQEYARRWQANNRETFNEYLRAYYKSNKERIAARCKAYNEANKERIAARCKAYNEANKERIAARNKAYREANKERIAAQKKAHYEANQSSYIAHASKRRASKLNRTPAWLTEQDHDQIKAVYKLAKDLTKRTGVKYVVDHYYPLQGKNVSGLHCPLNLQVIPATENNQKNNKHPDDFSA